MEIFVHIIKDLNRFLNLGLYILFDADKYCLMSLSLGTCIKEFPTPISLDLYHYLTQLKQMVTSWDNSRTLGNINQCHTLRRQICLYYRFDINKHFQLSRYGQN